MKIWAYVSLFAGIGLASSHHWMFFAGLALFVFFLWIPEDRWRAEREALRRAKERYRGVPLGHPPKD